MYFCNFYSFFCKILPNSNSKSFWILKITGQEMPCLTPDIRIWIVLYQVTTEPENWFSEIE
jgi:hypothetical protein